MTSPQTAYALARIAAIQAEIEAMKVANAAIDLQAYPPKYDEQAFREAVHSLEVIAADVICQ